ncbi:MAG TPA: hypothetical protein VEC16_01995 [Alphaproteobacteria bacterium]|nr:hypothetical protein [Alphaproteobacteria bacterium]
MHSKNKSDRYRKIPRGIMYRKAQVSMEYLIIFTVAFTMTLPLIAIYANQTNNIQADVTNAQLYKVATKISDYSEQVYYMGEPSQRTLQINFPDGINSVTVNGTNIIFNVTTNQLTYLVVKETNANLTGSIQNFPGQHIITFKAEGNMVNITDN